MIETSVLKEISDLCGTILIKRNWIKLWIVQELFITGHSHILKVMPCKKTGLLHMNPGAIGRHGFHKVRTMLRFEIDGSTINNLEVIELKR